MTIDRLKIENDAAYREDMRHRCLTDHFFLAEIMGFQLFTPEYHQPAVDLYFPKNPNVSIAEQHPIKNRMHLDPRGIFKTTLGRVDKLQWILAHPSTVTILNESATQELAKAISEGIANYFWHPNYGQPSDLLRIFPELAVTTMPFKSGSKWNTADRAPGDLDSTIAFTSPMSTQSGWHPWIINADDMVETKNSGLRASPEIRRGVIDTYDTNRNTLRGGGYLYLIGTRYHPFDLYGEVLRRIEADNSKWKVLIRGSLTVKNGTRLVPGEFPDEKDIIVHFGGLPDMDYEGLRTKFYDSYEAFQCQQQNDPQGGNVATFDEKLYGSCMVSPERIPPYEGETYICWRMPYGGKKHMTNAEGVAAKIVNGKVIVLGCWQGNYVPSKLAERMVQAHKEFDADGMMIMTTPGSEFMASHVRNEAARRNVSLRPQWVDWEESDDRRNAEIKMLEPMMKVGRIQFSTGMTKAPECRKQFIHFGLVEENGIIECISKLANLVPISQMRANIQEEELHWQRRARENSLVNSFLQQQGMNEVDEQAQQKAIAHQRAMAKATTWSMPPMPGGLDG